MPIRNEVALEETVVECLINKGNNRLRGISMSSDVQFNSPSTSNMKQIYGIHHAININNYQLFSHTKVTLFTPIGSHLCQILLTYFNFQLYQI